MTENRAGDARLRAATTSARSFVKDDGEKPPLELLPVRPLDDVGRVLGYGARKYAPNNWRKVDRRGRYFGAALRHLFAWQRGEDVDTESGLPHLAHAICCLLFLAEAQHQGLGVDDRPGAG